MKSRSEARGVALQVLFETDLTDHQIGRVLEERCKENDLDQDQITFIQLISLGVFENTEKMDALISHHAPEWPLDQVAVIDRNILRIALWELAIYQKTPLKVGINEAIELAKLYGTEASPRFVNGVLGSLVEKLDDIRKSLCS